MSIPESKLKPCPKCGRPPMYVNKNGHWTHGEPSKYVTCEFFDCIPMEEVYTVEEWQNLERPESPEARADHELMAAELSHEVSDARILSLLQLVEDIIIYPERTCGYVNEWLDAHDNLDNPDVEAKAATLRSMVK
jgi:hypothetical protein